MKWLARLPRGGWVLTAAVSAIVGGGCAVDPGNTADSPDIPATVLGTQLDAPGPTLGTPVSTFRDGSD